MANNTIVQYILKVNAKDAEKGLGAVTKDADKAGEEFNDLSKSTHKANNELDNTGKTAKKTSLNIGNLSKGIAVVATAMVAAVASAVKLQQKFADLTNELVDASTKTGIAVDTLAGLRLAAEGSGKSFGSLEGGLIKFQSAIDAANKGTKLTADAFDLLNVDVTNADGSLRNANDVFNESIKSLSKLENETQRNATAMILFGRSGGPALIQSGAIDNLESMTNLAKEFGVAIDENAIKSMAQFQRTMAEFETVSVGALQNVFNSIAGPNSITMGIQGVSQGLVYMGSIFGTVIAAFSQGFENAIGIINHFKNTLNGNAESSQIIMNDLKRETDQAVGNLFNVFQIASDELDRFNDLSEKSTAPQTMKTTGDNTQKTADEMERLKKATEETLKAQQELLRANDEMMDKTSDLAILVDDRLKSAYDKQLESIKNLGGQIDNQIADLEYQFHLLMDQVSVRKLSVQEQERLNSLADELNVLEEIAADNRIAEQKEIQSLLDENLKKEQEILNEKIKQREEDLRIAKQTRINNQMDIINFAGQVATLDIAGIAGAIDPRAGAIVSIIETLGTKTPKQLKEEATNFAKAIRNGIAILPTLIYEVIPQLRIALLEAVIDGFGLFFINLKNLLVDFFTMDRGDRQERRERRRQGLRDFFDPRESLSYASGGRFVPSAQGGIRFTGMQDGMAMLHRGEFVVPQSGQRPQQVDRQLNRSGGGMVININSAVVDRNAVDALVREIEIRFNNTFGTSSSNLFGGR